MSRVLVSLLLALVLVPAATVMAQTGGGGGAPPGGTVPTPKPVPKLVVGKPNKKGVLIREGQTSRLILSGTWYFRQDDALVGESAGFHKRKSLSGWTAIEVPHNWNGADAAFNRQSVGWYRKVFRLPRGPGKRRWIARFESVNNKARIYLNGKEIGRGGPSFLPFEVDLKGLKKGRNNLVVRVNSRRDGQDLTHWRVFGSGGWWNFGGLSREVYVRPVDTVDIEDMAVTPQLRKVNGDARIRVRLKLRNLSRKSRRVDLVLFLHGKGKRAQRIDLSPRRVAGEETRETVTSFVIKNPRLWRPRRARLYGLTAAAATDGERRSDFFRYFGIRKLEKTKDGGLLINGRRAQLRGFSMHEDEATTGSAVTPAQRRKLARRIKQAGATIMRAHYPLHPALLERFDREGIMVWDSAPIYQLPNSYLDRPDVRAAGIQVNRRMVVRDRSHPSVIAWTIGNELAFHASEAGRVGPGFQRFVLDAAKAVRELDRSRLVALDRQSRVGEPVSAPAFNTLDALGVNEYFGWYAASAAGRPASKTSDTGPFLELVHAALPGKPLFITEFGAEATGSGPVTEKGTYEFQRKHLLDHLAIHASKPFVAGSIVWLLKDYRHSVGWTGGNSRRRSTPPWNNKGVIDQTGPPKPAYWALGEKFRATPPLR